MFHIIIMILWKAVVFRRFAPSMYTFGAKTAAPGPRTRARPGVPLRSNRVCIAW